MISFAFCTYNRADRLDALVAAMRAQQADVPFEILVVNNNSSDDTLAVLEKLAAQPGAPLRYVTESTQGIVPARNRALAEAMDSNILIFMDDDELPHPGLVAAAHHAIAVEGAQCAGGRVEVSFAPGQRPHWLEDDLLGFLAEVNHGPDAFWIKDDTTPVWTANVAYDMRIFRDDPTLRFDKRFDRIGNVIGGGSDAIMFRALLERKLRLRYRPDMVVDHFVETWRLKRSYFMRLHYRGGLRFGEHRMPRAGRELLGVPPFLVRQLVSHTGQWLKMMLTGQRGTLRQGMNVAHTFGALRGYRRRGRSATTAPGAVA
ncbi:MAG: glycosyltransferase [Methyloversatilis discipulorum]|uniref:glycosyltransferase family A protein n=1 Tax=Methyloversatilis discipulorum TaxID=1119528 RepID=UPI0026F267E1|nr:glycosyltransferase family A protein [Methyloversatilis discipulorum]MBT9518568.1 glycosyltransferase [Methyloversatilis discipulorum]